MMNAAGQKEGEIGFYHDVLDSLSREPTAPVSQAWSLLQVPSLTPAPLTLERQVLLAPACSVPSCPGGDGHLRIGMDIPVLCSPCRQLGPGEAPAWGVFHASHTALPLDCPLGTMVLPTILLSAAL